MRGKKGNSMFITSPLLSLHTSIRHGFFTREGGVSTGIYASLNAGVGSDDNPLHVAENRRRMAQALNIKPENLISLYQIHSNITLIVDKPFDKRPQADGLVTTTKGLGIAAASADCGPVLFSDSKAGVIGACHAGRKGAMNGIIEGTIEKMIEAGATRAHIQASLGPLIRQQSYEVDASFRAEYEEAEFFIPSKKPNHFMFDLPGFIMQRLAKANIGEAEDLGLDTYSDPRFFSYRRKTHRGEADYGRHLSVITII
jgi:polyphenol oxidase